MNHYAAGGLCVQYNMIQIKLEKMTETLAHLRVLNESYQINTAMAGSR